MTIRPTVLHVIPSLRGGGAERQLVNVVTATMTSAQHVVCHLGPPSDLGGELEAAGVEVVDLGGESGLRPPHAARRLLPLIDEVRPAVVQTWLRDATLAVYLTRLLRRRGRWVITLHSLEHETSVAATAGVPRWKATLLWLIEVLVARTGGGSYVAVSEAVATSARRSLHVPARRLRVIHNFPGSASRGLPQRASARAALGVPAAAHLVLTVGRHDVQKGHDVLLRAFAQLEVSDDGPLLALVGEGPLAEALCAAADTMGVADRVLLPGQQRDPAPWYAAADVFAFPSRSEGFGLAMAEAMAAGLPVIASAIPAAQELGGGATMFVAPDAVEDLAAALSRLRSAPELRARVAADGLARVRELLDPSVLAARWADAWR